jgi:hypothetical protein
MKNSAPHKISASLRSAESISLAPADHRNIPAHPPDRRFDPADVGVVAAPRRTGGWWFGPLTCWLAALFLVAGSVAAAGQPDVQQTPAPFSQQGPKLVGTGVVGLGEQGWSVALSADSNTAIVGGLADNKITGAAWVYIRSNGIWTQQGNKLFGTGTVGSAAQGFSVALSDDGNTAIVGGPFDNRMTGAAWIYTRSGGVWAQQGSKLVGAGAVGNASQGVSVALSGDGNTAIVGGVNDTAGAGAAWVFIRSGGVWSQQGDKLVGLGAVESPAQGIGNGQGRSVALSADGNTAIVGGPTDILEAKSAAFRNKAIGIAAAIGIPGLTPPLPSAVAAAALPARYGAGNCQSVAELS